MDPSASHMPDGTQAVRAAAPLPAPVEILGCPFHPVTEDETVARIFSWRQESERRSHTIITVNVAILMMMRDHQGLADAIRKADMVVVDGKPLVWASRLLGAPLPTKVSGVDLMTRVLEEGMGRELRVFLLGTTQERLHGLQAVIRARYPGVVITGARDGYFKPPDYPAVTRMIRDARADLLLVGMPGPFKESWCEEQREALCTPAILGVGGAFDVLGGFVRRAPVVLQEAGMEWAWRLAMEPGKLWKRYLVTNSKFLALLVTTLIARTVARTRM